MAEIIRTGVSVSVNDAQRRDLEETLAHIKNGAARALTVGINRTGTTGKSRITRRLTSILALKRKQIADVIKWAKANFDTLEGKIIINRKGIPLYEFSPRPTQPGKTKAAGVSVKVKKQEPRKVLAHTFIAQMKSGHVGIFERRGRGNKRSPRLPIDERFGPTPLGVFANAPGVAQEELSALGDILRKNVASQVDRLLNRRKVDRD